MKILLFIAFLKNFFLMNESKCVWMFFSHYSVYRYCGDGLSRTIRSINNYIMLTLRSDHNQIEADVGFKATATLYQGKTVLPKV